MKKMLALILAILVISLYGCSSKDESEVITENGQLSEEKQIAAESSAEPESKPAQAEKKIASLTSYYNGEVSEVTTFSYNSNGKLERVKADHWYEGEVNYSVDTEYVYDEAGNLIAKKEAGIPYYDVEYVYNDGVCTGYIDNEYWDYGDGQVEMGNSTEYFFERDTAGNVVKLTADPLSFEVWTTGEYTYDADGRIVFGSEKEQYGDHMFTKTHEIDYSYKGIMIVTSDIKLNDYDSYLEYGVLLDDISCGPVYLGVVLPENGTINVDEDGYVSSIQDNGGNTVCEFEFN